MLTPTSIEPLEARIAPASISVAYTDFDGDVVKITATKPGAVAPPLDLTDLSFVSGTSGQLFLLNLKEPGFDGAKIVFTVTKKPGGDGLAHVGYIDALDVDLDQVVVKGDLGRIRVGDLTTASDPALNLLSVRTMGTLGLTNQGFMGSIESFIFGKLGAVKIAGDFVGAKIGVDGNAAADAQIGSIVIGGSVVGAGGEESGHIFTVGGIGNVTVRGDLIGGSGDSSGYIVTSGKMGNVFIGGDVIGGSGTNSGEIFSSLAMGKVRVGGSLLGGPDIRSGVIQGGGIAGLTIGGDVVGGASNFSGSVLTFGAMGDVRIGGDLIGGAGSTSGTLRTTGRMVSVTIGGDVRGSLGSESGVILGSDGLGPVRIGGDLTGGSVGGSQSVFSSGAIRSANGAIASVSIGGSIIAGWDDSSGSLGDSGAISAGAEIGPVSIGGSIVGNSTNPVRIIAEGKAVKPTTGFDLAIASLSVKGSVQHAEILAGFNYLFLDPVNADASIGPVSVGRNWTASSLVAGAEDTGADGFGANDALQTVGDTGLIARIASITIKGDVRSVGGSGTNFGFVAQQIAKLSVGGRTVFLVPGASSPADDFLFPSTTNVRLLEV